MSLLTITDKGEVQVVGMPARLVMASAPDVRNEIKALISNTSSKIVLDLSNLEFVDSSGLSVLISSFKAAKELDGGVVLVNPTKQVRSLIELTRLHHVFEIYDDIDSAVGSFG